MIWKLKHPQATPEMLGYLPDMFNEGDPRPAREQAETNHPGGWRPHAGFRMGKDCLLYPGDPPMPLLAETTFRDEVIQLYDCSWVAIVQPDGNFEIARMD